MKKYMYNFHQLVLIVACLISFFALTPSAFADRSVEIDGITFSIDKISYGKWLKPRQHMVNDMVERLNIDGEVLSYIAISYLIKNGTGSKKIDLGGKMEYQLFDDYGNRYRAMRRPADFKESVLAISKNFPSLYPGESFGETLFFEAPVSSARSLKLIIESDDLKLSRPIELSFERDPAMAIAVVQLSVPVTKDTDIQPIVNEQESPSTGPSAIKIISPDPGAVWDQGQSARVRVVVTGGMIPKNIILIALDRTFNDVSPKQSNVYDINVPFDQEPGDYMINIIAQWPDGSTSSAMLKFFVKDATPLGII